MTNQQVIFRYKATDTGKARGCNLTAEEFINLASSALGFDHNWRL